LSTFSTKSISVVAIIVKLKKLKIDVY
jgi:hypothetical protein